jgi:hypothetical protein
MLGCLLVLYQVEELMILHRKNGDPTRHAHSNYTQASLGRWFWQLQII